MNETLSNPEPGSRQNYTNDEKIYTHSQKNEILMQLVEDGYLDVEVLTAPWLKDHLYDDEALWKLTPEERRDAIIDRVRVLKMNALAKQVAVTEKHQDAAN